MKFNAHSTWILLSAVSLLTGCGEKKAETPAPAPEAALPVVQQTQPAYAPAALTALTPDAQLAESEAALKARDYDKAAGTLITMQRARLNEQQATAAAAQMHQLQSSLAAAVAAGDLRAKAAADRLRQAAMAR